MTHEHKGLESPNLFLSYGIIHRIVVLSFRILESQKRLYEKLLSYLIVERLLSLPAAIAGSMRPFCFNSGQCTANTNRRQIVPVTTHTNTHRPTLSLWGLVIEQRSWRFLDG